MLIGQGLPTFIAGGVGDANVSIPVAASAAKAGDLLVVFQPHAGVPTLGGSGWTSWTETDYFSTYDAGVAWKLISSTADVTVSGETYGHAWAIYRNVASLNRNAIGAQTNAVTFGALGPGCAALVILGTQQTAATPATAPSGFTRNATGWADSTFELDVLDTTPLPAAAGSRTISNYASSGAVLLIAAELRQ